LIVEIGTSESYNPDGLGNAMLAYAFYAKKYGAKVLSVDVQNVCNSRSILEKYIPEFAGSENLLGLVEYFLADAFEWVKTLHAPIDLLYMDAGYEICEEPNYKAFVARYPQVPSFYVELYKQFNQEVFQPGALMLFDDTFPDTLRGKGVQLIPYLLQNGWRRAGLAGVPVLPMVMLEKA